MRFRGVKFIPYGPVSAKVLVVGLAWAASLAGPAAHAQIPPKPTGAPLVLSNVETEQPIPLTYLTPDGKTAHCTKVRLHWISKPDVGPNDDATSFTLDLPADDPAQPIFLAQLWNASLASALAWQEPWQGARWKVIDTPSTDGSGLDAPLAVGMIATSARRQYPAKTVVLGSLNPDGSLGPVSHLMDRLEAASRAGMTKAVIPSVQRFDTDSSGHIINIVKEAADLGITCLPVDDLVTATQTVMNDPLPDTTLDATLPKYTNDVSNYIDEYAKREQAEVTDGLQYAPKESDLGAYPANLAAIWKSIYLDDEAAQEAYGAGQVFVAYELFARASGRMSGVNALSTSPRTAFDVKATLAESDDIHEQLRQLTSPPPIDHGDLQSAVVVAQMADWAYDINAALEGAQLVTKQAFSQRSDATDAEKERARQSIIFADAQAKYLLSQSSFYIGLLDHVAAGEPINVDANAAHLLPQLIPAQLATARRFTSGIRTSDLRDGLLFDPRLVAYVNVLRQVKADWDAHQRQQENNTQSAADQQASASAAQSTSPVELNSHEPMSSAGFDPGGMYKPPSAVAVAANNGRKLSDPALCLIWVNHDCEIATLDEKYLRLNGLMDPATHEWKIKDHSKLDALLQMAEIGARRGITFAAKTDIDSSVLAMIYEKAAHERTRGSDASSLDSLRNFWRCALLGNMCWQLAHTHKAMPVDLAALGPPDKNKKDDKSKKDEKETAKETAKPGAASTSTNTVVTVTPQGGTTTGTQTTPATAVAPQPDMAPAPDAPQPPPAPAPAPPAATPPPSVTVQPAAAPAAPTPAPAPAPVPTPAPAAKPAPAIAEQPVPSAPSPAVVPKPAPTPSPAPSPAPQPAAMDNIPVAPIAKTEDLANSAPVVNSTPPAPAPVATPAPVAVPVAVPAANAPGDANIPVAPIAKPDAEAAIPVAPVAPSTAVPAVTPAAPAMQPATPVASNDPTANIPVAPVAKATDYAGGDPATTNAAPAAPVVPVVPPTPKVNDNADSHGGGF